MTDADGGPRADPAAPVTISYIAETAGVSVPTVSKVINGRSGVGAATRARVEALVDRYGCDAVRWWLLRDVPRVGDADFTEARLVARANEDLANGLGNLVNRTLTLLHKHRGGELIVDLTKSQYTAVRHVLQRYTTGPDAVALPVHERYRFGVVVGSVLTETGERGCNGEVWLEPEGAPVRDVRTIAGKRLHNMFRFPQLLPGRYELGVRCFGFSPLRLPPDLDFASLFHGIDERVPVESLKFGIRVLDRFLRAS